MVLIDDEPPEPADAIVVLAGNAPDRLPWAERLRDAGYANLVVVSDEQVHTHNLETTWLALHEAGVAAPELPDSALLVLENPPPESTVDEARRDADLLAARGARSAILVTDAFHSRRAWLLFRAAFARRGMTVRSVPVADSYDLAHWWEHPVAARRVIEEYAKLLYYLPQGAYW
ncbi:MAG TPA: YdcF family protein [Chloroflexota bacterium]